MEKKGISPLLAYVLLIALSVSMAFLVINWVVNIVSNVEIPTPGQCEDIQLSLEESVSIDLSANFVEFNISNDGFFSVHKISVSFDVGGHSLQWCNFLNTENYLKPGDIHLFHVGIREYDDNSLCDYYGDPIDFPIEGGVQSVEVVPWIIFEDEVVNCNDRKLVVV